jgi:hypothetical protein
MRQLGAAFDPETRCEYTGLALHQFPTGGDCMGYWRTDGHLLSVRELSPDEKAWILANRVAYNSERAEFTAWLDSFPPRKHQ